jgi:hypothetical protein
MLPHQGPPKLTVGRLLGKGATCTAEGRPATPPAALAASSCIAERGLRHHQQQKQTNHISTVSSAGINCMVRADMTCPH